MSRLVSKQLEEAVLGGLLLAPSRLKDLALAGDDFHWVRHRQVFEALARLVAADAAAVDEILVSAELQKLGQWQDADLIWLVNLRSGGSLSLALHAEELHRLTIARRVEQRLVDSLKALGTDQDPAAIAATTAQDLRVLSVGTSKDLVTWDEANLKVFKHLEARSNQQLQVLETPWPSLDARTGGFMADELVIFAGRPGDGKSTMIHAVLVKQALETGRPVVLFSAEMGIVETQKRLLAMAAHLFDAELPLSALRHGQLSRKQLEILEWVTTKTSGLPVIMRALRSESPRSIDIAVRDVEHEYGQLGGIGVDYVQLLEADERRRFANRNEELSDIARGLKVLAGEHATTVITASQLVRRKGGAPTLGDLREGGNLEGHADFVGAIWCPNVNEAGQPADASRKFLCLKHRNGPSGYELDLHFNHRVPTLVDGNGSV